MAGDAARRTLTAWNGLGLVARKDPLVKFLKHFRRISFIIILNLLTIHVQFIEHIKYPDQLMLRPSYFSTKIFGIFLRLITRSKILFASPLTLTLSRKRGEGTKVQSILCT
jgi:hypothetical protein